MAKNINLTEAESKLADLIWQEVSLTSPDLVALAQRKHGWKKSTTYTILKKLCDKGVVKNENAIVSVILTREEQMARQSLRYIEDTFGGSLPKFIASFFRAGNLSPQEVSELRRIIDAHDGGDADGQFMACRGCHYALLRHDIICPPKQQAEKCRQSRKKHI